ncbi:MAG: hypothetical protein J2P24_06445 [Streptosporangiales bacterium]|nr:hypothetical protein [Streptosporangiales bacterium]
MLILVGSAVVLFVVQPSICKDTIAGTKVVHVCEPVGVTSAPALLVLIALVLLLLPEMSEVSVTGLLTLKRKADQAEQRSLQAMQHTADVQQQLINTRKAFLDFMPPAIRADVSGLVPPSQDGGEDQPPPGD